MFKKCKVSVSVEDNEQQVFEVSESELNDTDTIQLEINFDSENSSEVSEVILNGVTLKGEREQKANRLNKLNFKKRK